MLKTTLERKASLAAYYQTHKESAKARALINNRKTLIRNRAFLVAVKATLSCARCHMSDSRCLEFHHFRDKTVAIAEAVYCGWSIKRIQQEIDKCVVLCANCHRIETHTERSSKERR